MVGNKIVVVGGGRTGHPEQLVTQTEVYDGTSWQEAADIPVPGDHLAAASDGTYLYAVGGRRFVASTNTAALQRYDPKTDQWTALPNMPKPFSGAGAAVVDGRLIVVGGEGASSAFATVHAYDLTTTNWATSLPALPGPARPGRRCNRHNPLRHQRSSQAGHHGSTNTLQTLTFHG